jgi:hypothetical protein
MELHGTFLTTPSSRAILMFFFQVEARNRAIKKCFARFHAVISDPRLFPHAI